MLAQWWCVLVPLKLLPNDLAARMETDLIVHELARIQLECYKGLYKSFGNKDL